MTRQDRIDRRARRRVRRAARDHLVREWLREHWQEVLLLIGTRHVDGLVSSNASARAAMRALLDGLDRLDDDAPTT